VLDYTATGIIKLLFTNPDANSGVSLRLGVKGYGGDTVGTIFTGKRFYGWREIENGFATGASYL
jgi:hypothetical protein